MEELNQLFDDHLFEFDKVKEKTVKLKDGERRMVSILFADVKGFTALSEKLDHEEVQSLMDRIMKLFSHCVEIYGGYVDKYSGDQIMALFGAKKASEVDTQRAISSAIDMISKLKKFNIIANSSSKYQGVNIDLSIRVGINTGMVTTGKIGKKREGDFTVYGDDVNLAARMESNAPTNNIMIPEDTMHLVKDYFNFKDHGNIEVKGKIKPISVFIVESKKDFKVSHASPFVGRDSEMNLLKSTYNKCIKNLKDNTISKISVVGIHADAGIGKSRLIYEFIKQNDSDFAIGSSSNISSKPYHIFSSFIKDACNISIIDDQSTIKDKFEETINNVILINPLRSEELQLSIPFLGLIIGVKYDDSRLNDKDNFINHMHISLRTFLECLCTRSNREDKPYLFILEDIHWIDKMSYNALLYILDTFNIKTKRGEDDLSLPIIIATHRNDYSVEDNLKEACIFNKLSLDHLDKNSSLELINILTEDIVLDTNKKKELFTKSHGNPFFIEEWINLFKNSINENKQSDKQEIPTTLNSLILSRIDALEKDLRNLLQEATILGEDFFLKILSLLQDKLGLNRNINDSINKLEVENFIQQYLQDNDHYRFKHILTRDVSYNTILKTNKKILHKAVAEVIEEHFADSIDNFLYDLSIHYSISNQYNKAVEYLEKAGDQFDKVFDRLHALDCYNKILNIIDLNPHSIKKEDLDTYKHKIILKAAHINLHIGEIDESHKLLNTVESSDHLILSKHSYLLGNYNQEKKNLDECLINYNNSLELYKKLKINNRIYEVHRSIGVTYIHKGDYNKAMEHLQICMDYYTEKNDEQGLSLVNGNIGSIYFWQGNLDEAYKYCKKQYKISAKIDSKQTIQLGLGTMANIFNIKGDYNKALDIFKKIIIISEDINDKSTMSLHYRNIGICYKNLKQYDKAINLYKKQLKLAKSMGNLFEIASAYDCIGVAYQEQYNFNDSLTSFKKAYDYASKSKNLQVLSNINGNMGILYTDMGKLDDALNHFDESYKIFDQLNNIRGKALINYELSKIYILQEEYQKSIEKLDEGAEILKNIGDLPYYVNSLLLLVKSHRLNNNIDKCKESLKNILKNFEMIKSESMILEIKIEQNILEMYSNKNYDFNKFIKEYKLNEEQNAYFHFNVWKYKNNKNSKDFANKTYTNLRKMTPKHIYSYFLDKLN